SGRRGKRTGPAPPLAQRRGSAKHQNRREPHMRTRTTHIGSDPSRPFDPGEATLQAMRRFEGLGRKGRREFLSTLAMLAGAAPLAAQELVPRTPRTVFTPQHSPKVLEPLNVHEIMAIAAKNTSKA